MKSRITTNKIRKNSHLISVNSRLKGFTLLEMMLVMVFAAILIGALGWSFAVGLRAWNSGRSRAEIRQDAGLAMDRIVREIGQASSITIAQANQIKFDADVDGDDSDETVTFSTSDSQLISNVDAAETVLSPNVQTFALTYRDLNDNLMSFPITGGDHDNIRVVIISLTMDKDDDTISLSSGAYVRNQ